VVSDPNQTRRERAFAALSPTASRTWTVGNGQNQFSFTVANPQLTTAGGQAVFSVDLTILRAGVLMFADRVLMPNPATGIRQTSGAIQDNPLAAIRQQLLDSASAVTRNFTVPYDGRDASGGFH
jgi:hypothetical protein